MGQRWGLRLFREDSSCYVHLKCIPYFAVYNTVSCIMHTHIFGPKTFRKKIFGFNFLIQLFIYLYLETKLIIVFWRIILDMDIVVAF